MVPLPTPGRVRCLRALALGAALGAALLGALLALRLEAGSGVQWLDLGRAALIGAAVFWLAWGAMQGVLGLLYRERAVPSLPEGARIRGRTVILAPIHREDPQATFARLAAVDASLAREGLAGLVDLAVLSDTRDEAVARAEGWWFLHLVRERDARGRFFYRRRPRPMGRKAGNIAEFLAASGAAYDYALVLDADSLMEGATIAEMIRRLEADPGLGLLQTLPRVVRARALFGRAMQFSASLYAPIFARGLAAMQGPAGPFWGHNALLRVRAFAASCHLPPLSGAPPLGGPVMSHDYVEAALLVRGGWRVRLDPDLTGSYEEGPEDLLEHARRDRRWCQGNLQYLRLLAAPGLAPWSRFTLLQGVLSYLVPMAWLALLLTAVPAVLWNASPDYFPDGRSPFPVFPSDTTAKAVGLALGIVALLLLPKLLVLAKALATGAGGAFGGGGRAALSALAELALSSVLAPILLMVQARAVAEVLTGRDGGWPASPRGRGRGGLTLAQAWRATGWIALAGAAGLGAVAPLAPALAPWMLPVALPMILAPWVAVWTSRPAARGLFTTREEIAPPPILREAEAVLARWRAAADPAPGSEPRPEPEPAPEPEPMPDPVPDPARDPAPAAAHG